MRNQISRGVRGFTIIEIVVVLLLISIVAAAVFGRSISTGQMNFRSQFDKIRNQLRYPQSIAMKRSEWWGFANDKTHYWIFTGTNKDTVANQRLLPGQEDIKIALSDLKVTMTPAFTIIFDRYGIPYRGDWTTVMNSAETINLQDSEGPYSGTVMILPETGLVR